VAERRLRGLFGRALGQLDERLRKAAPAARLARQSGATARAWLRFRAAVEDGLGAEAAAAYTELVLDVADNDAELARVVAVSLPDHLARVRPEKRELYLASLREVLAVRAEALPLALRTLPELVGTMEADALRGFLAQGLALHALAPQKAESFLRRESGGGQKAARALEKGLTLAEVQRTLALYARAHCGEDVQVRPGKGRSFSDGHHIYLPEQVDRFGDGRDFLVYRVQTALAAGYLEFGTFGLDVDAVPGTWPERREGEGEIERFLRAFPNRSLARDLFQILEDARIEARIRAAYPGVGRDLDVLGPSLRGERNVPTAPAAQAVELLARAAWRLPSFPTERRVADAVRALSAQVGQHQTVDEVAAAVAAAYPAVDALMRHVADEPASPPPEPIGADRPRPRPPRTGGPTGGAGGYEGLQTDPLQPGIRPEAAGADERKLEEEAQRMLQELRAAGQPADRAEVRRRMQEQERRAAERERFLDMAADMGGALRDKEEQAAKPMNAAQGAQVDPDVASLGRVSVYREWDATIEDYKPRWVAVREQVLKEGSRAFVDQVMQRRRVQIDQLRRRFEALRPQGLVRARDLPDGDDLDIDRMVEAAVARRIGAERSDRLYVKRQRQDRDVAVAFLLDLSSSTNESADGSNRRIIDVEKEALIVAAEALNALGDRFAVWGFSGYGRDHVNFYLAKEFSEPWDDRARERVGRMTFKMENRDGAAIRHATRKLAATPARVRLLFLLSDGRPLDCGCDHYFDRYAQEDTRVALREARVAGIHPFCITVDPTGPQYLARMYGEVAYTVIDKVDALPSRLVAIYKKLAM